MLRWRHARVRELRKTAHEARADIRRLFEEDTRNRRGGEPGWGQFLDGPKDPRGSYGTSAGVQVLAMDGYPIEGPGLGEALSYLSNLPTREDPETRADLLVTYKLSSLAEATEPASSLINDPCPVMDELVRRCAPIGGWAESSGEDWTPQFLATAVALHALRRYPRFGRSESCVRSLKVLSKLVIDEESRLRPSEIALGAIVLTHPWPSRGEVPEVETATKRCKNRLDIWTRARREESLGYPDMFIFRSRGDNRYLILLPDCLTALALLQLAPANCLRGFVPKAVTFFAKTVRAGAGFRSPITARVSTVDHLWLARLFRAYEEATEDEIPSPGVGFKTGIPLAIGHAVGAALMIFLNKTSLIPYSGALGALGLGLLGVSLGYLVYAAKHRLLQVVLGAEASVFLALLARLLYDMVKGG